VYVCKIKSGHVILAKLFIVALRGKKLERKSSILLTALLVWNRIVPLQISKGYLVLQLCPAVKDILISITQ
jgi:hypothetical protein